MNTIKKISLHTAGAINMATIAIAMAVHLLVILQMIPYTWINGGRSTSLGAQQTTSIISIIILFVMVLINLYVIKRTDWNKGLFIVRMTVMWILFAYSIIGTVMQLIGTPFEKICMSVLCIINAIMYFRLAIEKYIAG